MNTWKAALACGLLVGGVSAGTTPVHAQGAQFPDVPANHWAYQAVTDLADKGYVKGYPDGKFLGKRALTRYEFATVIDRMAQTVADLSATVKAGQPVTTPTGTPVTQDDLNKIQALTDSFQKQLTDIQSLTAGATSPFQDQIDAVRADLLDVQANVAKAQSTADSSFGIGGTRKFQISGYVQARYFQTGKSENNFPQGTPATNGSYNGNYAQGGNNQSFELRRSRLKVTGQVTPNAKFAIQLDASGATAGGAQQQVTVREGNIGYTFGDGSAKYPTVVAGLFALPFGYELPVSAATILTPERPLAFNESGAGLFTNQDYDKGAEIVYGLNTGAFQKLPLTLTAALVNGNGRTSEETDRRIDQVYHAAYLAPNKTLGVGVSYYNGQLSWAGAGVAYQRRRKQLFGADAQLTLPQGPFLLGEYVNGKFEQRTFFNTLSPTTGAATQTFGTSTQYAPGNKVEGYYIQGGYTFGYTTPRPLSLFVSYDVLRRAEGGLDGALTAGQVRTAGGSGGGSFTDENIGYGASYNLDKQTRFRLYYIKPQKVAHAAGSLDPPKIAETIGELQIRF